MTNLRIMGAGILGLSAAFACAKRGARVTVVDPRGPGGGASGGLVGALAPHTPESWNEKKAFQFKSLVMAEAFWSEVDAQSGQSSGYGRVGRVQPIANARQLDLARQRAATADTLWEARAIWRVETAGSESWTPASPTGFVIRDTLSARLHPRRACASLVGALQALGATLTREPPNDTPDAILWATGVEGLQDLSVSIAKPAGTGVKGQAALLDFDARNQPQLFGDGIHIVPHLDGTVAIGSTSERDFTDGQATDALLDGVLDRAIALCPALSRAPVVERWAGVRPRSATRAPCLGPWPDRPWEFFLNGGFKIGFGMAPLLGECAADLILEGRQTVPESFTLEAMLATL